MCQADRESANNIGNAHLNTGHQGENKGRFHPHTTNTIEDKDYTVVNDLGVILLNVCGLKSKLKSYEFEEFIQKYKLIFLTETKLNILDEVNIPNYNIIVNSRKGAKRSSGGVAILVHESIEKHIQCLDVAIKETLWIKLSNSRKHSSVIFGLVYNPPEDSPYADSSTLDLIENAIVELTSHNDNTQLCLMGDFNARTGQLSDNIRIDDHDDLIANDLFFDNDDNSVTDCSLSTPRVNSDKHINNRGRRLIELCRSLNLIIMNGRYGKDSQVGKKTCKNSSTVDYVIISAHCIESVSDFAVMDFEPLFSDIHCPI